jgi:hypothetical protein
MKMFFLIGMFFATNASANPFNNFIGEYSIANAPSIEKQGNVKDCVRFGFQNIVKFSVLADSSGNAFAARFYTETPGVSGYYGYSLMEISFEKDPWGFVTSVEKNTGDANRATHESSITGTMPGSDYYREHKVSIQNMGEHFLLKMTDSYINEYQGSCIYKVNLERMN